MHNAALIHRWGIGGLHAAALCGTFLIRFNREGISPPTNLLSETGESAGKFFERLRGGGKYARGTCLVDLATVLELIINVLNAPPSQSPKGIPPSLPLLRRNYKRTRNIKN